MLKYSTENGYTREQLEELQKRNVCSLCSGRLEIFRESISENKYFLACSNWVGSEGTHHEADIERPASRYEKEGLNSLNLEKRRKILTEEHGTSTALTKVIDRYQGVTSLTKPQATEILEAVYPQAPTTEIKRACLLCHSYGLNPLMKHIYLIPFKNKDGGKDWVTVMGISAKRLLATRRGSYSYVDDTPRIMTDEEQKRRHGSIDKAKIWFLTKLKDTTTGAEASGEGWWPANSQPYGTDKGNTIFNMASIRSESQALNRLYPGEMPVDVDVVPDEYAEAQGAGVKVETIEAETKEIEASLGICPIHNVELKPGRRPGYAPYCPNKIDGKWCKGKAVSETEPEEEPLPGRMYDPEWVTEQTKKLKWGDATVKSWLNSEFKIDTSGTLTEVLDRLDREQLAGFFKEIEDRLGML